MWLLDVQSHLSFLIVAAAHAVHASLPYVTQSRARQILHAVGEGFKNPSVS